MTPNRKLKNMLWIKDDAPVLSKICQIAASDAKPLEKLYSELNRFQMRSKREVHFCRGYLAAIMERGA